MSNNMCRYAQASIGQDGYRHTVRGNGDVPGCVDLVYEEWNDTERRWHERIDMVCLPVTTLAWLAQQAAVVMKIEEGEGENKEKAK